MSSLSSPHLATATGSPLCLPHVVWWTIGALLPPTSRWRLLSTNRAVRAALLVRYPTVCLHVAPPPPHNNKGRQTTKRRRVEDPPSSVCMRLWDVVAGDGDAVRTTVADGGLLELCIRIDRGRPETTVTEGDAMQIDDHQWPSTPPPPPQAPERLCLGWRSPRGIMASAVWHHLQQRRYGVWCGWPLRSLVLHDGALELFLVATAAATTEMRDVVGRLEELEIRLTHSTAYDIQQLSRVTAAATDAGRLRSLSLVLPHTSGSCAAWQALPRDGHALERLETLRLELPHSDEFPMDVRILCRGLRMPERWPCVRTLTLNLRDMRRHAGADVVLDVSEAVRTMAHLEDVSLDLGCNYVSVLALQCLQHAFESHGDGGLRRADVNLEYLRVNERQTDGARPLTGRFAAALAGVLQAVRARDDTTLRFTLVHVGEHPQDEGTDTSAATQGWLERLLAALLPVRRRRLSLHIVGGRPLRGCAHAVAAGGVGIGAERLALHCRAMDSPVVADVREWCALWTTNTGPALPRCDLDLAHNGLGDAAVRRILEPPVADLLWATSSSVGTIRLGGNAVHAAHLADDLGGLLPPQLCFDEENVTPLPDPTRAYRDPPRRFGRR